MNVRPRRALPPLLTLLALLLLAAAPPPELGRRGLVASDHVLASQAGASLLAAGGNAVDAVVAAALAAGVVQPAGSGLGGGGFAVLVTADGQRAVLDFREVAPAAASRDMFAAESASSVDGGLAVAVPSEAIGLVELHRRYGALPLPRVVKPAVDLARRGFRVGPHLMSALEGQKDRAAAISQALFQAPTPRQGDLVTRPALAATLQRIGREGDQAFRGGPVAEDIVNAVQVAGGVLSLSDMASYQPREREPLVGHYRGWTVVTMPPPSSGGAVLLQILAVLEASDLAALGPNRAETIHRITEAMKHAYADRAQFMGDPDRVVVPLDLLLSEQRIAAIRASFDPERTFPPSYYGTPTDAGRDGGTHHISVMDAQGLSVALTTTINTSFGSKVVAPQSGVLLNNEMDDFVARPGVPNAYGLMGSEANAVAPGCRPLSSMTPTVLISPDGQERVVVGGSGGPFIISGTLEVILNLVDFGMSPSEAVAAPRFHHQWAPDILFLDQGTSEDTAEALRQKGHTVKIMPFGSAVQAIRGRPGEAWGASDPRKAGLPVGVL